MSELPEVLLAIVVYASLIGAILWAGYFAFGPQAFGLPVLIGVLVVAASKTVFSNAGLTGVVFIVVGLVVLMLVIGMAMRLGSDRRRPPQ